MVRIRLSRVGSTKQPSYRIVVMEREAPRNGRYLEILGHYNPRTQPGTIEFMEDRAFHWMSVGAQPSDSVVQLFKMVGTLERFERFKAGEDIEKLMKEAAAIQAARNISQKTERGASAAKKQIAKKDEEES
jgi:small subunit ribosomal protein S16